jgi:hypothetical protein
MRRPLVALISTALLAWPFMAVAQQPLRPTAPAEAQPAPSKVFRVGILTPLKRTGDTSANTAGAGVT